MPAIIVRMRHHYGAVLLDPVNDPAKALARIARTKTLTTTALADAICMGCTIEIAEPDGWADPMLSAITAEATARSHG